jgi:hypothetical protein
LKDAIIIVSGLPRSGTSMMMRMLDAGGMEIVTDNIRRADDDNPRGYYEFERAKKTKEDASWLADCYGKVVKMITALLYDLPVNSHHRYKVIFMLRDMKEVLASQRKMLERRGQKGAGLSDAQMIANFEGHLEKVRAWLKAKKEFELLYIDYGDVIANGRKNAEKVNAFLGNGLDVEKMTGAVEEALYRQRKKA